MSNKKGLKRQFYEASKALGAKAINLVMSNNDYLLRKAGKTLSAQIKELSTYCDIEISPNTIHSLKMRPDECVNQMTLMWFSFLCNYWGISLGDFFGRDFEVEDRMKGK